MREISTLPPKPRAEGSNPSAPAIVTGACKRLQGRLDTTTSPELFKELDTALEGVKKLVFDLTSLEYISSSGLRVLLSAQKTMNTAGEMIVCGVSQDILEIFDVTGFSDFLTIE